MGVLRFGLYFIIAMLFAVPSYSDETSENRTEKIDVSTVDLIEAAIEEAVATLDAGSETLTIKTRSGVEYDFPSQINSESFYGMTEEEIRNFQKNRVGMLRMAATALGYTKLSLGLGSLAKGKITQIYRKIKSGGRRVIRKFVSIEKLANGEDPITADERSVGERGHTVIYRALQQIDAQLFAQARLVAEQNEIAVAVGLGFPVIAGFRETGMGGSVGLTFSFGYNRSERSLVFETTYGSDRFQSSSTGVFNVGPSLKFGVVLRNQEIGADLTSRSGTTMSPPQLPGYLMKSKTMLSIGYSSSVFSLSSLVGHFLSPVLGGKIATILTDLMSYVTTSKRYPLLRISASKVTKDFVRFQYFGQSRVNAFLQGVKNAYREVGSIRAFILKLYKCAYYLRTATN
ncbi:MAG: hypothetical protein KDD25_05410 [Bdellovibrionales bacterium]|nr:hypothetical protein [Bdellovibrionales bacterium]